MWCLVGHLEFHDLEKITQAFILGYLVQSYNFSLIHQGVYFCVKKNVTDGRTDGRTDRRTEGRTGQKHIWLQPVGRRHNNQMSQYKVFCSDVYTEMYVQSNSWTPLLSCMGESCVHPLVKLWKTEF